MALVLNDRVKETTTTTGTGTVNLGGAETGFETFVAGVGDGNTTYYCITAGAEFEVGLGTVTDASPDTLSRTTILSSSNSDSAVDFSAGTKDVFCTLPASKAVFEDASSNVTLPGTLDVDGGITVDNITIDGTEIDLSSGDLTIDVAGNIQLDADDNGEIRILDGGTQFAQIKKDGNNALFQSIVADGDFIIQGIDSSSFISALTLDMSDAGTAIFNHDVRVGDNNFLICGAGDDVAIQSDGTNGTIFAGNGNLTLDVAGDINIDADGGDIYFKDAGTEFLRLQNDSGNINIRQDTSDKDILLLGNDGGSSIVALTLDMSEAGAATFNSNVTAFSDARLKDNIETLKDGLDKIEQLRGVTYTRDGRENIGVIAQEVEKILPEIVKTADDEMGTKSVDYSRITAVLIEAVKELSARVKELENK